MPVVTLDDCKSKKKPASSRKKSIKKTNNAGRDKAATARNNVHTLAEFEKPKKRPATSTPSSCDDSDETSDYSPQLKDSDNDAISVNEDEMEENQQHFFEKDGKTMVHFIDDKIAEVDELLRDIKSSENYKKMQTLKDARLFKQTAEMEEEAKEAGKDPNDPELDSSVENPEASYAMVMVMVTDINNKAAGMFNYESDQVYSDEHSEWEVAKFNINIKKEVVLNRKKLIVEIKKTGVKIFEDGSIGVRLRTPKDNGPRRSKRLRTEK